MKSLFPVLAFVLPALLFAGCARPNFSQPVDGGAIEKALLAQGLRICVRVPMDSKGVQAFVRGTTYDLASDCSGYDSNSPDARVSVAVFTKTAARDAAQRTFESGRRPKSPAVIWARGPVLVTLDGSRSPEAEAAVRRALASVTAP